LHKAGEKLFIDFAGKKLSYIDLSTGEVVYIAICNIIDQIIHLQDIIINYRVSRYAIMEILNTLNIKIIN